MDPQSDTFTTLVHALQEALPSPIPPSASPMARPGNFSGEAAACSGFLLQCSLYLEMQPQLFPTERSKIAFIISLLSGRALQWAEALWNADSPQVNSLESFVEHFREVFSLSTTKVSVHDELLQLQQANSSIHEYTLRFRTLAASSGWNDSALLSVFRRGLNATVRRHMSIYEDTVGLESFLLKASRISQHLIACHSEPVIPAAISSRQAQPPPEPMVTDNYHLTPTERSRRIAQVLCLYCGSHGHVLNTCPVRPPCPAVSTVHITPTISSVPHINASLLYHDQSFPVKKLVDSGASGNFIASRSLTEFSIPRHTNQIRYQITTIQGKPLGRGLVRHHTPEVVLRIGCLHSEPISLLVLEEAVVDIVLGHPWLARHQPTIDWKSGEILRWSENCIRECMTERPQPRSVLFPLSLCSTTVESPDSLPITPIPPEYHPYSDVFSKTAATRLPPHRRWDCAIDLLPGAKLPKGRVYPLSIPERTAMEEYVKEALQQGFIRPSTSPAASSFFFVAKKDGGLRPCIDYRALNDQTVKFAYPLPLVPASLEELRDARIFSKLDLRSAYNLRAYNPKKIDAVRSWPRPTTVKELQRFLGFANFYRRFVAHYSQVAAPLTSLLKRKTHSISWAPEAEQAFHQLKSAFCTAPALIHPDPNLRFVVEVDAATLGVGAALSQWKGETPVLHPCAYFSRKLSPAEQNYDVGNRELLAIKLALEEWRHWLEGAQYPFEVITDHKNLQYLRDAKRLNPRQARWALFFTRFNFTISYRPGNKNIKADALSRLHQPDPTPDEPEPILPSSVFLSPIQWALDDQIRAATLTEPAPPGGPEGKEYVPSTLRLTLLDSVHTSPGSGHPGSNRTLSLLQGRYWWPNMARDVVRYVKGCSVCAISSTPRKLPEGKLVPLPIPRRPWSHLGIDFATDLPPSDGYTTILVVVDRFSKWCKLIPLRGLPTALETAETLFQHVLGTLDFLRT